MEKEEYDRLIKENYVSRIAFKGDSYPYVALFCTFRRAQPLLFVDKIRKKINTSTRIQTLQLR